MKKFVTVVFTLVVLLFCTAAAAETIFDYKVDQFEITGNLPGYAVDDFGDNIVAPWSILYGTVDESDGHLNLKSPGTPLNPPGYPSIIMERSDVMSPFKWGIQDGSGDFVADTTWAPIIPDLPGGFYGMGMDSKIPAEQRELTGIAVANLSNIVAANLTGGPGGLQFIQTRWVYDYVGGVPGDGVLANADAYLFDEVDLTGAVVLRMAFDDTTNQVTTSFSLDGGATFLSPLSAMQSSLIPDETSRWFLSGDPMEYVPEPSGSVLLLSGIVGLAGLAHVRRE